MEQSNISRDHIALVAMEIVLNKLFVRKRTIWNRIGVALGICGACTRLNVHPSCIKEISIASYEIADAMIEARTTPKDEETEE